MDIDISADYGTQRSYQLSAEQGMFVLDDLGYYITANYTETEGFRDNSDLDQNDASLKVVLDKAKQLRVSLYADYIHRENGRPGPQPPDGTTPFSFNGVPVYSDESANLLNDTTEEDTHLVLKVESRPLEWLGLNFQTDYTAMETDNYNRYYSNFAPPDYLPGLPGSRTEVINEIFGLEGNVELKPLNGATLLIGAPAQAI